MVVCSGLDGLSTLCTARACSARTNFLQVANCCRDASRPGGDRVRSMMPSSWSRSFGMKLLAANGIGIIRPRPADLVLSCVLSCWYAYSELQRQRERKGIVTNHVNCVPQILFSDLFSLAYSLSCWYATLKLCKSMLL